MKNNKSWPDPMDDSAYFGLAGKLVRMIEPHSEADPVALLINFLVGFGSIIGSEASFTVESDKHPGRLFAVLVGETSKARKGTSWGRIKQILIEADPSWESQINSGLSSGEGLINAVKDEDDSKRESLTLVKDKRLLAMMGEFASLLRVLAREGNTLSAVIRDAWDHGDLQTMTKNSPLRATKAHISILAHITITELVKYLAETEAANGFGNRFLWVAVRRSKSLPFGGENYDEKLKHDVLDELRAAIQFSNQVSTITWSDEAKPLWAEVYPGLSEGKPGLVGALTSRAEAQVIRIAVIYAILDLSDKVMLVHLEAALSVWEYCACSAEHIFGEATGDSHGDKILKALKDSARGVDRTKIGSLFGRHVKRSMISRVLESLAEQGSAHKQVVPTNGRSREVWYYGPDKTRTKRNK